MNTFLSFSKENHAGMRIAHKFNVMKTLILFCGISLFSVVITPAQTLTTLVQFDGTNGLFPFTIIQGTNGNFYGTTAISIFKMNLQGSLTVLTNLQFMPPSSIYSMSSLIQGNDGSFYGTRTYVDSGTNYAGMIFSMTSEGAMTILTNFETNGIYSSRFGQPTGLIQGKDGNFYGTMQGGLDYPYVGSIFKITPQGVLATLVNFNRANQGAFPNSPPIQANDGNFYGTTIGGGDGSLGSGEGGGTIYKMTPDGNLTTLVIFEGTNGYCPSGCLVQASDGNLYGTCGWGGLYDKGTIFRLTTNGVLVTLFNFNGTNGTDPATTLLQASDGNFYGTTTQGGFGDGTIFKVTLNGTLTTLVTLHGTNGSTPYGSLIQAADGNLYGTTSECFSGSGTIFKITGLNLLPSFQSITLTNGTVNLAWNSVSNWTYRVQYKTSLTDTNWTDLPGDVLSTNVISSKTDVAVPTQCFYRLLLLR